MISTPPAASDPLVSVVMVTHGAWSLTERALSALTEHADHPLELIFVDNNSQDETRQRLSKLRDARVILNAENRGFGAANNQGVAHAQGRYLLLLNTDAFVHPGWLEPLLQTLEQPGVGAVVPRYLHSDGSLQEAGALLAQDGTVLTYGDGDDPEQLCYRFRRVVDFGGAACMLIRRATFEALGGFDTLYGPAYYEDVDLCLRLAQHGLAVVYEPSSTVTHARYGSSGAAAAVELSERNRVVFVERWGASLAGRPRTFVGASPQAVIAARDVHCSPRMLIFADPAKRGAGQLAEALLDAWPAARVTWATGDLANADGLDLELWLARGVEMIDREEQDWLKDRRFHYDVAILGARSGPGTPAALAYTQPQAECMSLDDLNDPATCLQRVIPALAQAGIAPPKRYRFW